MATQTTDTSKYKLNHTMIRVKDPVRSVKFYELLGMKQIQKIEQKEAKFDLYFLAYDDTKAESHGNTWTDREGVLELTHNYGTENDDNYKTCNGNKDEGKDMLTRPDGGTLYTNNSSWDHALAIYNIEAACERLEKAGVRFQKKLKDGRMKHIAFALDPDDYWVEIVNLPNKSETTTTDLSTYRMNHTMIRVKDPEVSLEFYKKTMGMSLLRTAENPDANFNLYFLGYKRDTDTDGSTANREGLLELTWNYGTEKDDNFKGYHNGNSEPQGFGHIAVVVDDLDAACARFESLNVNWKKRLTDGRMKTVAFILDPDGYWIEVFQNEKLKERAKW